MSSVASNNIDDLESFLITLQNVLGVVVPDEQRSGLVEKITPLLTIYKLDSLSSLSESLANNQPEVLKSVVLDVISQFQLGWQLNSEIKDVLNNYIFAQLSDNAKVWLVGCGQGQAAYAMAMEVAEYEHRNDKLANVQLLATDVLSSDIEYAQRGQYNIQQLEGLGEEYKKLFMTSVDNSEDLQVKEKVREKIKFKQCDLVEDFKALGTMDLIICPDVLAYFSSVMKMNIIKECSGLLKPGAILLMGADQIISPDVHSLERVEHAMGIFYRKIN